MPALAVADALAERGAEVSFIGTRERAEAKLVPAAGYEIDFLNVTGMDRSNPLRAAAALGRAAVAVGAARRLLRERGADAVMGGGGYVAAPAGIAAVGMRIPLVLTEADSHLGLTNRMLAPRARRVCLAFPIEGREGPRYLLTGTPGPGGDRHGRPGGRPRALRHRRRRPLPADLRRQPRRAQRQPGRGRGIRAGGAGGRTRLPRPPHHRDARLPRARRAARRGRRATRCSSTSPTSATRSPPPTSSWRARADRSSS